MARGGLTHISVERLAWATDGLDEGTLRQDSAARAGDWDVTDQATFYRDELVWGVDDRTKLSDRYCDLWVFSWWNSVLYDN